VVHPLTRSDGHGLFDKSIACTDHDISVANGYGLHPTIQERTMFFSNFSRWEEGIGVFFENDSCSNQPSNQQPEDPHLLHRVHHRIGSPRHHSQGFEQYEQVKEQFMEGWADGDVIDTKRISHPMNGNPGYSPGGTDRQGEEVDLVTQLGQGLYVKPMRIDDPRH
jgi:hypothetical protein